MRSFRRKNIVMKKVIALFLVLLSIASVFPMAHATEFQFTDIPTGSYYYDAVHWAVENGITNGKSATVFDPNSVVTRQDFFVFLYRFAELYGDDISFDENNLQNCADLNTAGNYAKNAVKWVLSHGYTYLDNNHKINPYAVVTREFASYVIGSYMGHRDYPNTLGKNALYTDSNKISSNTRSQMSWMVDNGILTGTSVTKLSPTATTTRAQIVVFLFRLKEIKEHGNPVFSKISSVKATCKVPSYDVYQAKSSFLKINKYTGPVEHKYRAILVSDATTTQPTKYRLKCVKCSYEEASVRSLGKPIRMNGPCQEKEGTVGYQGYINSGLQYKIYPYDPYLPSNGSHTTYKYHVWTNSEKANGITLYNKNGTKVVVTRKWFASAWCYIAEITLPAGQYGKFQGIESRALGETQISSLKLLQQKNNMIIAINGEGEKNQEKDGSGWNHLRGGIAYDGSETRIDTSAPAYYWNPKTGTYGSVGSLVGAGLIAAKNGAVKLADLRALGVTDTIRWWSTNVISSGAINKVSFDAETDNGIHGGVDTYNAYQGGYRRQRTFMGFKKDGSAIHVYLVVSDGFTGYSEDKTINALKTAGYTDAELIRKYSPQNADKCNDSSSYGLTHRECMLLLSMLGCDCGFTLDGGSSSQMVIRTPAGNIELMNVAGGCSMKPNLIWDFFAFSR